jgi:hypothetical protein
VGGVVATRLTFSTHFRVFNRYHTSYSSSIHLSSKKTEKNWKKRYHQTVCLLILYLKLAVLVLDLAMELPCVLSVSACQDKETPADR